MTPPKGETCPQTVEVLQDIMALDAAVFQDTAEKLAVARRRNRSLEKRLERCRKRHIESSSAIAILKSKGDDDFITIFRATELLGASINWHLDEAVEGTTQDEITNNLLALAGLEKL